MPKRIVRADWLVKGRDVFSLSRAVPGLVCVPGLATPDKGLPVAVRGRELKCD